VVHVEKWIKNPEWQGALNESDIALVKLTEKLDLNGTHKHLVPVCLPTAEDDAEFEDATDCVASGWGQTETDSDSDVLRKAALPIWHTDKCIEAFAALNYTVADIHICAGGDGVKTTCYGDSGGPLECRRKDDTWVQLGIVSWGKPGCLGKGFPTVFTRVSKQRNWMKETMDAN